MSYFGTSEWYQRVSEGLVPNYKIVDKWGRNEVVGTVLEPIISSSLAGAFWTPTAASTVRIKAGGDANDTSGGTGAREIEVEGLDENYALASETITTNGASASTSTTTTFTRVHRAFVTKAGTYGGSNAAEIMIENTAGTVDIITVDAHSSTGQGQSLHCQYSAPANSKVWLIFASYNVDTTKTNDVHLRVTDDISAVAAPFGATRTLAEYEGVVRDAVLQPPSPILLTRPGIVTPMDVWIEGSVSATTSIATARMQLLLRTGL